MLESDATQGITDSDKGKCMVTIKCKKDEALKIRTQVSNAANEKNRTARIHKNAEPVKDDKGNPTDQVLISFTLNPKHKPRRGTGKNGPVVITHKDDTK
jgi:hypothetical protein